MTRSGAFFGASCCAIERTGLYVDIAMVYRRRRMVYKVFCCNRPRAGATRQIARVVCC